jgi:hypothetical protein
LKCGGKRRFCRGLGTLQNRVILLQDFANDIALVGTHDLQYIREAASDFFEFRIFLW